MRQGEGENDERGEREAAGFFCRGWEEVRERERVKERAEGEYGGQLQPSEGERW